MPAAVQEQAFVAPFDDSRKALCFALNRHLTSPPTAMMNQMMASARIEAKKRKTKRKKKSREEIALEVFMLPGSESPEQLLEMENKQRDRRRAELQRHPSLREQGLARSDEAHLAGFILYHFGRLDREHREVLAGLHTEPAQACNCRQPCCSGWRPTERWVQAVRDTCETLLLRAEVSKSPGKKGMGSQPLLRQLLVELFFLKEGPTLSDIARRAKVTLVTAAAHRTWIHEYLETCEQAAWLALDPIFDQAGIAGAGAH